MYENKEKEIGQGVKNVIRQRITENGDESEKS